MTIRERLTIQQLAVALTVTRQAASKRANQESWLFSEETGRGGRKRLYETKSLPAEIREAIMHHALRESSLPVPVPSLPTVSEKPTPTPANLKDWQRSAAEARAALVAEVKRLAEHGGTERAIMALVNMAAKSGLPEHLQQIVPIANARSGKDGKRTLSRRSLYRWLNDAEQGFTALAPKNREKVAVPAWAQTLLRLRNVPQGVNLTWVMEQLPAQLPAGTPAPSYSQARRFIDKMSAVDREAGRMGPREIKSIRAYVKRDSSGMWPTEAYTADGHAFDAEIAHPAHGKPFRPELTTVLDIATRKAVGWSAGLAESTWAVLDALRHACFVGGIPAIFYVDNGSGYKNDLMANEATGFMGRLAITMSNSLPYNSQARGVIERSHQTIWIKAAKTLPTYMGADMDREAKQKVFKITRADIKAVGSSRLLMPWAEFVAWCQVQIDAYNRRPHRALPKMRDTETGKLRHQSPNEAWQAAINEGWQPVPVEAHEADDLFRPYKECVTRRAMVQLFSNSYFHRDLEHHHGETVRVGYDIHDASRAWVRDNQGRLICVAEFEGNKRSYFPESFIEQAAQKRATGRIKRAQVRIDEAEAELDPPRQIEHMPAETLPVMDFAHAIEGANVVRLPEPLPERPMFDTDAGKYRWLTRNPETIAAEDDGWMAWYRTTSEWEDLFGEDFEEAAGR
ncbi:MAG: Mu transposase C-terminal domain-containing protein [Burkholderiales bacterium]|nr:Mu transposase C-terminal domain-containing protein [Burkholderiales bacterium]